ncbi:MAG: DUF1150 family protein [Pseudomonadota bacterium]
MKSQIVYIREAKPADLPDQLRGQKYFALHDGDSGEQLALVPNREHAFALAKKNDLTPISVH